MAFLELYSLNKSYGGNRILKDFSLDAGKGEFISLLGASGCGKTTVLRMITGLLEPDSGSITIKGRNVFNREKNVNIPAELRNVGLVFQSYALWPHMNLFDNVAYPLKIKKLPKSRINARVNKMLSLVDMEGMEYRSPHELSGGQQQRAALARALAAEPEILLLDEPLSNLDVKLREKMRLELKMIQEQTGITILYVTHDQLEALTMSDKIIVMERGEIRQSGTPYEIYRKPASTFVADFVGGSNILNACIEKIRPASLEITAGGALLDLPAESHLISSVIPGQHASLIFKPENVKIVPLAEEDSSASCAADRWIAGTILHSLYRGSEFEYLIRLGCETIRVLSREKSVFSKGEKIKLKIMDGSLLL